MKRPTPRYEVTSVIVCDDVRQEVSGKEILIGVYNNVAISSVFPIGFHQLFFRVTVDIHFKNPKSYTISVEQESTGRTLANVTGTIGEKPDDESSYLFGITLQGFVAEKPMVLLVRLGIDREPETVGKFAIRQPISDSERERLVT